MDTRISASLSRRTSRELYGALSVSISQKAQLSAPREGSFQCFSTPRIAGQLCCFCNHAGRAISGPPGLELSIISSFTLLPSNLFKQFINRHNTTSYLLDMMLIQAEKCRVLAKRLIKTYRSILLNSIPPLVLLYCMNFKFGS